MQCTTILQGEKMTIVDAMGIGSQESNNSPPLGCPHKADL